jgi:hypothetical protein
MRETLLRKVAALMENPLDILLLMETMQKLLADSADARPAGSPRNAGEPNKR